MKKIVFVIPQLYGGGAERVTAVLANEFCNRADTEIHMINYFKNENDYFTDEKVIRHYMDFEKNGSGHNVFSKIRYYREFIKNVKPDCVISLSDAGAAGVLALSLFGTKTKLILSERNNPFLFPESKVLRAIRIMAFSLCNGIVFQTKGAESFFPGYIQKKGTVIKNPITGKLPEYDFESRKPRIVNWCRLHPQKNLELLINSFADISEDFPGYTLEIYGEGPEKERLLNIIGEKSCKERIILRGHSNNVLEEVKDASLFVSSSDYEGISNSMLEALSMGIPCICTDCPPGGAKETICDGANGILVPVGERKAMAEAMRKILSDEKLAKNFSDEGKKLKEELSAESIADQWFCFMNRILN